MFYVKCCLSVKVELKKKIWNLQPYLKSTSSITYIVHHKKVNKNHILECLITPRGWFEF